MQDPRQSMDDLFAMDMISGNLDKKKDDGDGTDQKSRPSSGGHYPSGGNSGGKPSQGGCLTALVLLPVMPLISLFRDLFS